MGLMTTIRPSRVQIDLNADTAKLVFDAGLELP